MTVPVEEWKERAACADLTLEESDRIFFGHGAAQAEGVSMCRGCPVVAECRAYADSFEEASIKRVVGVWGGEYPAERIARRRAERGGDVVALAG